MVSSSAEFAIVRITDIYRGLPSTSAMQKEIQTQREAILQDKRAVQLRSVITELQSLQGRLQSMKDDMETDEGKKLVRDFEIKRQEAETLRQEFEDFRAEEDKRINKLMVGAMRASLNKISAAAQQIGKERNFHCVFDTSGNTNTGLPFVVYSGDAVDLSEDVIGLLGEKKPDEGQKAPVPPVKPEQ